MQTVLTVTTMQRLAQTWKREGVRVALVPTMGYLHAGHVSLMHKARSLVGPAGKVVVSIYVNPTQFGPREDLRKYPRDLSRDKRLCRQSGVDLVFVPSDAEMYPGRALQTSTYSTYVVEEELSVSMEGSSRPTHFRGVTTVVAKLLHLTMPDLTVFGAKDFQQAAVVRRMIRDLNFPVRLVVAPTVRDTDGLAVSSRNKYLTARQRVAAGCLYQALCQAREEVRRSAKPLRASSLRQRLRAVMEKQPQVRVDYIEFFEPDSLVRVTQVGPGHHMALAAYVGRTRLIDNGPL